MKILVIGGTQFIGRHVVSKLVQDGHSVTLLNRGRTGPNLFPDLPTIKADREAEDFTDNQALKRDWDAVVDLCAFYPKDVDRLLKTLKGQAGRYVLFSTLSAYVASAVDGPTPIIEEGSPLRPCSIEDAVNRTMSSYGRRKAECERVAMAQNSAGVPVVILRPAVVYGEYDHTDRMAYWIWRASRNTPFILPDDGLTITRRTYAPDLAVSCSAAVRERAALGNAYNIAETDPLSFRDTVYWCGVHFGTKPLEYAVSVSSERLEANGVKPWVDLPMWIPKTNLLVDTYRSRKELGFQSTPAARALADAADAFLREDREPKTGLSPGVEAELLGKPARK